MLDTNLFRITIVTVSVFHYAAAQIPALSFKFNVSDNVLSRISAGIELAALGQISTQIENAHSKRELITKEPVNNKFLACTTCRAIVNVLVRTFRESYEPEHDKIFKSFAMDICDQFHIQTPEVCSTMINFYMPTGKYIAQDSKADARTFCSLFMELNLCDVQDGNYNWTLNIDDMGSAVTESKSYIPAKNGDELRVLHITDIHYDPLYTPGSLAECDEPQCCQRGAEFLNSEKAAGYWGDYRDCDAPWHMIEDALNHIKDTHTKIDFIYQTGDIVDHMVWGTSKTKNSDIITKINKKLAEIFPNVPILPCIGNHEPHPVNLFSPNNVSDKYSTDWLYEYLYEDWSIWLPIEARNTILKGGYYTVPLQSGFRVIALNNNECLTENWWLFYEGTNKIPQLQWLHDTLLAAEKAGEYVHILAHVPTGDGTCWSVWAREFNRLVERFRNTISGIFNGHSHDDEINLHYSANGHAIGIVWNGGALTPASNKNPNYRIYHVDTKTLQVVDSETWIFNLTEANAYGKSQAPIWFKEYEFSSEFTTNLSPAGIDALLDEMTQDVDMLRKFWRYKVTSADPKLKYGCGRYCLLSTICRIATTVNNQKGRCEQLKAKLDITLNNEDTTEASTIGTTTPASEATTNGDGGIWNTESPTTDTAPYLGISLLSLAFAGILYVF